MAGLLKRFVRDERGMETVEWAVLAALIVAGLIGVVAGVGSNVLSAFSKLKSGTTTPP